MQNVVIVKGVWKGKGDAEAALQMPTRRNKTYFLLAATPLGYIFFPKIEVKYMEFIALPCFSLLTRRRGCGFMGRKWNVMPKEEMVERLTDILAKFYGFTGKRLPDDVRKRLEELKAQEDTPLARVIYDTMTRNQELAMELNRPSCQDTGAAQFFLTCGAEFPLIAELPAICKEAVRRATKDAPLRHNAVETFDEYNTGENVGKEIPSIFWDIVPGDSLDVHTYMAGGGCTLPGSAKVLMPGEGYEGVAKFVLDVMTSYGLNACPPLLVGVGIGTSVEVAALHSKRALMRPIGSHNPNERAAKLERLLEDGINKIGLGPQGVSGKNSVLGVNVENSARHPSVIGVAVNVGCWSHRRGHIVFDRELNYTIDSHSEVDF